MLSIANNEYPVSCKSYTLHYNFLDSIAIQIDSVLDIIYI